MTMNIPAVINEELNELVLAFNILDILHYESTYAPGSKNNAIVHTKVF